VTERQVVCLSIDMVRSVDATLVMSNIQRDRFNLAFVKQITPYLDQLRLLDAVIKFTGDGWLIMKQGDRECARAMLVLAKVMAHRLADDLRNAMGDLAAEEIPGLRQAICSAYDLEVTVPGDRIDYVGDSARLAVRSASFCPVNQVIVDEAIRLMLRLDFEVEQIDTSVLPVGAKRFEEDIRLYRMGDLKENALKHSEHVPQYVALLNLTGKLQAADQLVRAQIAPVRGASPAAALAPTDRIDSSISASSSDLDHEKRRGFRELLRVADPNQAKQVVQAMRVAGYEPDTVAFNQHIRQASTDEEALAWLRAMEELKIEADRYTFHTLMNRGIGS
jgi:hypothetical protein